MFIGLGTRGCHRFVPGSFDGKEITTAVSLRLLPLEMLYEGASFKNHKYRKESLKRGLPLSSNIPRSKVVLIVNDVFDPIYGYYEGGEDKAVEMKSLVKLTLYKHLLSSVRSF
jgi:hypothetical protein